MATGFKKGALDLDDIFDPYVEGTKPASTGYKVGAVDLNQRYAPLEYGTQAAVTGMKIAGGDDLNTLWAAKGTASYNNAVPPDFPSSYDAYSMGTHNTGCSMRLSIGNGGTWAVTLSAAPGGVGGASGTSGTPTSGTWLAAGSAADYEVRFTAAVSNQIVADDFFPPTYTPSTGWLSLATTQFVEVETKNHPNGDLGAQGTISGTYLVEFRKVGSEKINSATMAFALTLGPPL